MIIQSNLALEDFDVVNFYGVLTCFAWQDNNLITFPHDFMKKSSSKPQQIIKVPNIIRNIVSYAGRVFVICKPTGIYKLSGEYKLHLLSKTAVGIGSVFHEVLIPKDSWLYKDDKLAKTSELLLPLKEENLCILVFRSHSTDPQLRQILNPNKNTPDFCLIANGKNLFKLTSQGAQIIYSGDTNIVRIISVKKESLDSGIALLTDSQTVVVTQITGNNYLVFKSILFDFNISSLSLEFLQDPVSNEIFIVYADNEKVNAARLKFGFNAIDNSTVVSNTKVVSLKIRDKKLIGLSRARELIELELETETMAASNSDEQKKDFYQLDQGMLKGTGIIMDTISERAKELTAATEKLMIHQDKLNRVNIYSQKKQIDYLPKIKIERTSGRLYIRVTFDIDLPINSQIIVNLSSQGQKIFVTKVVSGLINVLEVPLKDELIDCNLNLTFDLVTLTGVEQPWCIIKNYFNGIQQRGQENKNADSDKKNFINTKYEALKKFVNDEKIDMKKLVSIKNSLRKEFPN